MYNRYIPEDAFYTPVEETTPPPKPSRGPGHSTRQAPFHLPEFLSGTQGLSRLLGGREGGGLSGLLKSFHLDQLDSGDILLLLIVLYLLVEGDDMELAIALGLVLFMGLGEEET